MTTGVLVSVADPRTGSAFVPRCPIENVSTMAPIVSGPSGLRWSCRQCGVVVVMPRRALARALAKGGLR